MDERLPWSLKLPTYFHTDDQGEMPTDDTPFPLPTGMGVVFGQGERYRVVDTWLSFDKHGRFDMGYHVFLERIDGRADDLLGQLAPDYFVSGQ